MSSAPRVLVRRQEQNFGPYSLEQINSMLLRGEVDQDNLAWVEGAPDWQPVRTLPRHSATAANTTADRTATNAPRPR